MEIINELKTAGLDFMHFALAYAGLALSLIMKMAEEYTLPDFRFRGFLKKNLISIIFSIVAIPVILIVATDTSIREFLPITYLTAVLAGWQTQEMFKSTFTMVANRRLNLTVNGSPSANGTTTPQ